MPNAPSFLVLDNRDGGTPRVWRFRNGSEPIQVGNDLPGTAAESTTNNTYRTAGRRVIQFKGAVYAIANDGVYKLQNDDSWSKAAIDGGLPFTDQAIGDQTAARAGFEIFYRNNKPYLIGAYRNTSPGRARAFWLDPDTEQWVEGTTTAAGVAPIASALGAAFMSQVVFRDKIFYYCNHNNVFDAVYTYTPATDTWAATTLPGDRGTTRLVGDLCVFNDKLYFGYIRSDLNAVKIAELNYDTNTFNAVLDLGPGIQMMYQPTTPYCLYTDDTYMYVVALQTNSGFRMWRLTSALASVATDFFPAVVGITNHNNSAGFQKAYSFITPGIVSPILFYRHAGSITNPYRVFKHIGPTSKWQLISIGGNIDQLLPHGAIGGPFDFVPGENDIIITGNLRARIGETLMFKAYGGGIKSVRFYYSLGSAFPVTQLALRNGSATGNSAVAINNQVNNVLADGITEYTVDVDGITAAIESDTDIRVIPVIIQ